MNVNKKTPLVSVLLPCYNHEKYVGAAIESVLNQTFQDFELIVLDNGSTDGSYEVIKKYEDRIDKIIHFDVNDIWGAGFKMAEESCGKYLAHMTSDDIWAENKLELQMQAFQEKPDIRACFTWTLMWDENMINSRGDNTFKVSNRTRYEWLEKLLLKGNCFAHPTSIVERDAYFELVPERKAYYQLGDMYLWIRLLLKYEVYVVEEPLLHFRWHASGTNPNMSAANNDNVLRTVTEHMMILEEIIELMEDDTFIKTFGRHFKHPEASTPEEIICEKFLFLLEIASENHNAKQLPVNFYYKQNRYVKGVGFSFIKMLEREYNYTYMDFQKYCAENALLQMRFEREKNKYLSSNNIRGLYTAVLAEALEMSSDKEILKSYYKKRFFAGATEDQRSITKLIIKCMDMIFDFIDKADDAAFQEQFDMVMDAVYNLNDSLEALWNDFLCLDMDVGEEAWHEWQKTIQRTDIGPEAFCDEILPFLIRIYKVLKQYAA